MSLSFSLILYIFSESSNSLINKKVDIVSSDLTTLQNIIEIYKEKYKQYPSANNVFKELISKKLIGRKPKDPWGTPYHYMLIDETKYDLYSFGENKLDDNGSGDDVTQSKGHIWTPP